MASGRFSSSVLGPGSSFLSPGAASSPLMKLTQETELQKMLADEKMRSDQHKTNYQTLKVEHTKLQDEYLQLQNQMKEIIEEGRMMQDKYKQMLDHAQQDIAAKQGVIEELGSEVVTPQRMEIIRLQIAEEVEQPYREKFTRLDSEVEKYRSEYNKLRYEFSFLSSEYEHDKLEHKRVLDELKMQHEAEVTNLRKEREAIILKQQTDVTQDVQRVRVLQRENAQLHLKIKGLLTELEEIRAQREHLGLQSDHVTRLQTKQLTENAANVRALETEKQALKLQVENLQKEISSTSDLYTQMTSKIHELEKDNIVLKNTAEEVTHRSKVELTNLKMEMLKERGELERERDRLATQLEDIQSQLEVAQHSNSQQAAALVDKERECVQRVQAAREDEWEKMNKVETEKLELEAKLQEIERRKIDQETERHAENERMEELIKDAQRAKEMAEKEANDCRNKLHNQEALYEQMQQEREQNSQLKSKVHQLETDYNSAAAGEQQLNEIVSKLKNQVTLLNSELRSTREQLSKTEKDSDRVLAQHRGAWADEKAELQKRVEELDKELAEMHSKINKATLLQKKKKQRYEKLVTKYKRKLQLLEAKVQELELERDILRKNVPLEVHNKMKKQLKDIFRRHNEFRTLLLSSNTTQVPIGNMSFATASFTGVPVSSFLDQEKQHQRDLQLLRQRLDQLEDVQKRQDFDLRVDGTDFGKSAISSTMHDGEDKENEGSDY